MPEIHAAAVPPQAETGYNASGDEDFKNFAANRFVTCRSRDYDAGVNATENPNENTDPAPVLDVQAVFLTHYIPLYQVRVLQEITKRFRRFDILLSTPIEPNRDFQPDWSGLRVQVQKTVTLRRRWRHKEAGFDDPLFVHLPYDTISRLKQLDPDVVISHELGARSLAASRYCRRYGKKLVLTTFMSEHTEQGRGWMRSKIRRHLISRADAITFNGPSCREYLISLGADPSKLFSMPYAADDRNVLPQLPTRDEDAVRRRLLCIGQLSDRKGVMPLVQQLSDYCRDHNQSLELTLVGDGPHRVNLEALAHRRAVAGYEPIDKRLQLNILGNQPAADLPGIMNQHGVVIAPTLADEWLLVVNEAMHAGMPVIGSIYAQAVTTMVRDGKNGWQYDPLAGDLGEALDRYLSCSVSELSQIRMRGRAEAATYTPHRSADGVLAAVGKVLELPVVSIPKKCCQAAQDRPINTDLTAVAGSSVSTDLGVSR